MRHGALRLCFVAGLAMLTAGYGCGSSGADDRETSEVPSPVVPANGEHVDSHGHAHDQGGHGDEHAGPHGGHVIELGRKHEHHAEIVENTQTRNVSVYLLDKELRESEISQPSITMNLTVDDQPRTYELSARKAVAGGSSCFQASTSDLFEALHEHDAAGKLMVIIDGKPYSGDVGHHHHVAE